MRNLRAIMRVHAKSQIMVSHYTKISTLVTLSQNGHLKIDILMPINKRNQLANFMPSYMSEKTLFLLNCKNMGVGSIKSHIKSFKQITLLMIKY